PGRSPRLSRDGFRRRSRRRAAWWPLREFRRGDVEVVPKRPVDEALSPAGPDHRTLDPRRQLREEALGAEHPAELQLMAVDELRVMAEGVLVVLSALDDRPQLVAELDPEVEGRPDALGGQREALPGRIADEEDALLRARP